MRRTQPYDTIVINWQHGDNARAEAVYKEDLIKPTTEMPIPVQLQVMYEEIMLRTVE